MTNPTVFLRRVLVVDGTISGLTGLLMILGASVLESALGVPAALLRYAGLSLVPFVAFVFYLARRESLSRASVWAVIAANAAWVAASVLLLVSGRIEPSLLGYAFILGQAIAVAGFAEAQYVGLRKSSVA
jgi:hypothetical protein